MSEIVEALYDFQPQGPDDLELRKGQRIEVYEHLSPDWMRGKNLDTGREGVLPANYVRPSEKRKEFSRPAMAAPQGQGASDHPQAFNEKDQYQPPPQSWGQQQQPPQQYQQYQPPQQQYQQQPPVVMQQQQQEQPQRKHHFGNLARRFGDSVVFGAGATLGSDIINKIF